MLKKKNNKKMIANRKKYNETYRVTAILCNPDICFDTQTNNIMKKDSLIVRPSPVLQYKIMAFTHTMNINPAYYKFGNQLSPIPEDGTTPAFVYTSNSDNTNLLNSFSDINPANGEYKDFQKLPIIVTGCPDSASDINWKQPNQILKSVYLSYDLECINVNHKVELIIKTVRFLKPFNSNLDLSVFKTTRPDEFETYVQGLCNNHISPKDDFSTIWLYKKVINPAVTKFKTIKVRKKLNLNYFRTVTSLHTDLSGTDGKIGQDVSQEFKSDDALMHNHVMTFIMVRTLDDNKISIIQTNESGTSDIKDLKLVKNAYIAPVDIDDTFFKIRGYFTSYYGAKGVSRPNSTYSYSMNTLNDAFKSLNQPNAIQGDWSAPGQGGNVSVAISEQSTEQKKVTPNSFNTDSGTSGYTGVIRVIPPYACELQITGSSHKSGTLNTTFDRISWDDSTSWTKD